MTAPTCIYCSKPVTRSQLNLGDAMRLKTGHYAHVDCLDDFFRPVGDPHRREEAEADGTAEANASYR